MRMGGEKPVARSGGGGPHRHKANNVQARRMAPIDPRSRLDRPEGDGDSPAGSQDSGPR